jgi:hypothetical protein
MGVMSNGPIEFIGETSKDTMPDTEYGGRHGLIQPEFVDNGEAHSELTESEKSRIIARYGRKPLPVGTQTTGELDEPITDPATGRELDPADLQDVTGEGGKLSDLQPK